MTNPYWRCCWHWWPQINWHRHYHPQCSFIVVTYTHTHNLHTYSTNHILPIPVQTINQTCYSLDQIYLSADLTLRSCGSWTPWRRSSTSSGKTTNGSSSNSSSSSSSFSSWCYSSTTSPVPLSIESCRRKDDDCEDVVFIMYNYNCMINNMFNNLPKKLILSTDSSLQ